MPHQRRDWLLAALDAARVVAKQIISKEVNHMQGETGSHHLQKHKLKGANHYSHVALASVARIYIRLATLFPTHVDLKETADDIIRLADVLEACRQPFILMTEDVVC